ncbi:MAG TPA: Uma2 family endonuclease [Lacipirellulaceae bacterium]|nr:Uma2 family endonuclease [Lacipirellulaceae bacterium]
MSTTSITTADELLALPTGMGQRYELVAGELRVMSPSGWAHGKVVAKLHNRLGYFIEQHDLGIVFGAETGFRLASDPDTVRAPDFAFIRKENIPKVLPDAGFWPGAPDLAVEVLSPGDRTGEVDEKIDAWLAAGCRSVWIIDPKMETVTIYLSRTNVDLRAAGEVLEGDPVVPSFRCAVDELFR